ncbi:unnamed protein product [Orchesella dallaii]|uniref:F-box domain-containing protein n=1 Tax=Orchesella dallaii TaxID=48710 RepID=A0ABP1PXI9_9HEXA
MANEPAYSDFELLSMEMEETGNEMPFSPYQLVEPVTASAGNATEVETKASNLVQKLFPEVLREVIKYLPKSSVLNCRRINKDSKTAIDHELQKIVANVDLAFEFDPLWINLNVPNESPVKLRWEIRRRFYFCEDFTKFNELFMYPANQPYQNGNHPFMAGHMEIYLGRDGLESKPERHLSLMNVLHKFGDQLSSFAIYTSCRPDVSMPAALNVLRGVKNIRHLKFQGEIPKSEIIYFRGENLPPLPKLTSLDLGSLNGTDDETSGLLILSFLQRYGSQLEIIDCGAKQIMYGNLEVPFLQDALCNIRSFTMNFEIWREPLVKIGMIHMQRLEHLRIRGTNNHMLNHKNGGTPFLIDVMRIIHNSWGTLKYLDLLLEFCCPLEQWHTHVDPNWEQQLPNLTKLRTVKENLYEKWFWRFATRSCLNLQELHIRDIDYKVWTSKNQKELSEMAFSRLENLKKVVCGYNWYRHPDKVYSRELQPMS